MRTSELVKVLFLEDLKLSNFSFYFDDETVIVNSKNPENLREYDILVDYEYSCKIEKDKGDGYLTPDSRSVEVHVDVLNVTFRDFDSDEVNVVIRPQDLKDFKNYIKTELEEYLEETLNYE